MKTIANPLADLKSLSETNVPFVSGNRNAGAWVPSGSIIEFTAAIDPLHFVVSVSGSSEINVRWGSRVVNSNCLNQRPGSAGILAGNPANSGTRRQGCLALPGHVDHGSNAREKGVEADKPSMVIDSKSETCD